MAAGLQLEFLTSADRHSTLPALRSEVAFVGRSNVGKSTLINAIAQRRNLAHTSKTPGRTQLLNLFVVAGEKPPTQGLMDLPGYGYAKGASKATQARWQSMIETYLLQRESLAMVAVLVDGLVGPTELDATMLEWLRHHGVPHSVIATKADKVKSTMKDRRRREVAGGTLLDPADILWVSAAKGIGIGELRQNVLRWLDS